MKLTIDIDAETFSALSALGAPADVLSAFAKTATGRHAIQDQMIVEQREANAHMVVATLEARDARAQAEQREREQHRVAEFREQFIGILGHDLRSPLGTISLSAEALLQHGHLAPHDAVSVGRILRTTERMTRMVTQLLDLARARSGGTLPVRPQPAELGALVRSVAEELDGPVRLALADDLAGAWDPDRLAELISHLVRHALAHALPETGVDVRAFLDRDTAVVAVTLTGAVIPPDLWPSVFEPFRPEKRTTSGESLGLGLYIAKQIALAHGGTIDFQSDERHTTFTARLPRITPTGAAPTNSGA